ncbi:MAG: hypothetical protein ACOZQL_18670 [Myxococcota bacterium]
MLRSLIALSVVAASSSFAAVTVRYHNGDSTKHTFDAVCSGSKSTLVTDGNTTGSATIQGSGPCKVSHAGGEITLSGGENIEIKNGKISK